MNDNKDKEVIKNLQAKTDIIYKMEDKASKVLVLAIGSSSIKMGFANEKVPFEIKPLIAYKNLAGQTGEQPIIEEEEISSAVSSCPTRRSLLNVIHNSCHSFHKISHIQRIITSSGPSDFTFSTTNSCFSAHCLSKCIHCKCHCDISFKFKIIPSLLR